MQVSSRLVRAIGRAVDGMSLIYSSGRLLAIEAAINIVLVVLAALRTMWAFESLSVDAGFGVSLVVAAVGIFAARLSVIPGGLGFKEGGAAAGAAMVAYGIRAWVPVTPVQAIEAGGAVPDRELVPLDATRQIDVVLDCLIYSAAGGVCVLAVEEDHVAAPAACIPDWGAVTFTVGAGVTYFPAFVRCMTTNINVDIGIDGAASNLPANDDSFTLWGYYRYV